jgi:hypothetical protein
MLTIELMPDFIRTVNPHIGLPNTLYFRHEDVITLGTYATQFRIPLLGSVAPVA